MSRGVTIQLGVQRPAVASDTLKRITARFLHLSEPMQLLGHSVRTGKHEMSDSKYT